MINIAILGFGTIGSGVYELINTNKDLIEGRLGDTLRVKYALDLREFPGQPVESVLTHDFSDIVNDPEVSIVVETMGGINPAYTFEKAAIEAGKSVVTSNKELVEAKGPELMSLAKEHDVNFFFGASVGGGIPVIRPLIRSLNAERIDEISGILNGTTNYILTHMAEDHAAFDACLTQAQAAGYAEANPAADVEGHDAARKIAILSSIVLGRKVSYTDVYTEGITGVTEADMEYAAAMGGAVRLVARMVQTADAPEVSVAPYIVRGEHPLCSVRDVFNAIMVHGNFVDRVMFYGRGAGSHATASAVVSDVMDAASHPGENVYAGWSGEPVTLKDSSAIKCGYLARFTGDEGRAAELAGVFGDGCSTVTARPGEIGVLTGAMTAGELESTAAKAGGYLGSIRVLD